MTVSWFRSDNSGKVPMKEAVKALYPPRTSHWERRPEDRSRFSNLLLAHGEKHIQDWAVIAYTNPCQPNLLNGLNSSNLNSPANRKHNRTQWAQDKSNTSTSTMDKATKQSQQQQQQRKSKHKKQNAKPDKDSYPSMHMTKIEGRLHLCSLSIVFEPTDPTRPCLRCPFMKMDAAPKEYPPDVSNTTSTTNSTSITTGSYEPMCVELACTRHYTMNANHAIGPFETVPLSTLVRFTFLHSSPRPLVDLCQKLFYILHHVDKKHYITPELDELLKPMMDRPFCPTNLVDVRERPLTSNLKCHQLLPLQIKPGCAVLTQERLYFQPAQGVLQSLESTTRAKSWLLTTLIATARRYHGLKDVALELFWKDGTSTLLALERKHEREQVLRFLPTVPCHTDRDFVVQCSQEWQSGHISNYDYLLLLNSASGRTFQDLSRYPVFPWIISDYTSAKLDLTNPATFRDLTKPVGALNEERLDYFRQRFESMQDMEDPFLYGTHYSAAGYVLYYLVRSMPQHMLCLQNGKLKISTRIYMLEQTSMMPESA
jgi:factor associated with neutral sphingomyelinase activation